MKIRITAFTVALTAAAALSVLIKVDDRRVAAARERASSAALAITNALAQRDSTRDAAAGDRRVVRLLGDSLRLFERRVTQAAQHGDALDKALEEERIERASVTATIDSLRRISSAAVLTKAGAALADSAHALRQAHFEIRQAPYTVAADASIPPPPDSATIALRVALDPIPLDLRLWCEAPNADGIRAATIAAAAPRWASVRFNRVEQAPELCASPAIVDAAHPRRARFIPLVVGLGATLATHGGAGWGLFVGAGVAL